MNAMARMTDSGDGPMADRGTE